MKKNGKRPLCDSDEIKARPIKIKSFYNNAKSSLPKCVARAKEERLANEDYYDSNLNNGEVSNIVDSKDTVGSGEKIENKAIVPTSKRNRTCLVSTDKKNTTLLKQRNVSIKNEPLNKQIKLIQEQSNTINKNATPSKESNLSNKNLPLESKQEQGCQTTFSDDTYNSSSSFSCRSSPFFSPTTNSSSPRRDVWTQSPASYFSSPLPTPEISSCDEAPSVSCTSQENTPLFGALQDAPFLCTPQKNITESPLPSSNEKFGTIIESSNIKDSDEEVVNNKNSSDSSQNKSVAQKTIKNYFKISSTEKKKDPVDGLLGNNKELPAKKSHQLLLKPKPTQHIIESEKMPMFELPVSPRHQRGVSLKMKPKKSKKLKEQTYIDVGQKDFGHVTCTTCGMVYTKGEEDDENQHAKYHQKLVHKLKFPGWKNERIHQEFFDGHIISITSRDHQNHKKKLGEIREIVDAELGFTNTPDIYPKSEQQAYLFISSKRVVGCAIALPVTQAYPVIPTEVEENEDEKKNGVPSHSWCCSTDPVTTICGISRIWVFSQSRRKNIATRLVDCIRHNFLYGCVIEKRKLAFSDPTPNGRAFAEKYTGLSQILVFR